MTPPPQDYIIFHPKRTGYAARGEAFVGSERNDAWSGTVWTDPWRRMAQSNEDPFVWDHKIWLYSFCHATQLRRRPSTSRSTVRAGSRLFFCETAAARCGWLRVDTVFLVDEQLEWQYPGVQVPMKFLADQEAAGAVWERHLRHGIAQEGARGHVGRYTYLASLDGRSFLPLNELGEPLVVDASRVANLGSAVKALLPDGQRTYPCELTTRQADELELIFREEAATRVVKLTSKGPIRFPAIKLPQFSMPSANSRL